MADALSSGGSNLSIVWVQLPPTAPFFSLMDEALIETFKQWNIASILPLQVGDFQLLTEYRMVQENGGEWTLTFTK